jgi:hypothetical protein
MKALLVVLCGIVGFGFGLVAGALIPNSVLPAGVGPLLGLAVGCVGGYLLARTMP